jgi:hypothetical protein
MRSKTLTLLTAVMFLIFSFSCSHSPKKPPSPNPREETSSFKETPATLSTSPEEDRWWKRDEYQWLIAFLIVLGTGIAIGAAIYIASGPGGLTLWIHK